LAASTVDVEKFKEEFGDPSLGVQWPPLFLPNGTKLSMTYKGRTHIAEVRMQQIVYQGQYYSPSELARAIASNTSRNAWRDLMIKRPTDDSWKLAYDLRRQIGGN
jgi:hypothetical protein